jgi:acetyl-CoA carboxylase biotin carboxyl carrier protein
MDQYTVVKSDVLDMEDVVVVKSPSYGLFYSQPEPGAPPYTTVGAAVKAGDTVGLVEIMKTFNAISSPIDGEVVAIHVRNEEVLEPEQPLVSIKAK